MIPDVQIDPTQASVSAIARGVYDIYLRTYADSVRDYGHAVVIGFGHEMNTSRYSWGYGHVRPQVFVAAWRHIVTLFHSEGADNVTWLWTINQEGPGSGNISDWWPGPSYVTWVGIDGYHGRCGLYGSARASRAGSTVRTGASKATGWPKWRSVFAPLRWP